MARKAVDFGKDNWYGTPVNVYLEDDGTYTFEYGPSGNLSEVKKGLTKDAAIKMLKDKTNGPRYNSRACNSTNPVVANAMRASGGVARNADGDLESYYRLPEWQKANSNLSQAWKLVNATIPLYKAIASKAPDAEHKRDAQNSERACYDILGKLNELGA